MTEQAMSHPEWCPANKPNSTVDTIVHINGVFSRHTGRREDLINEGFATEDMFPEGRKRVKSDHHFTNSTSWSVNKRKGGIFEVRWWPAHPKCGEPELPREEWNPGEYRRRLLESLEFSKLMFLNSARGGQRRSDMLSAHKMAGPDLQLALQKFHEIEMIFTNARVERIGGDCVPYLRRVK